ncbi:O-antigen ligase [Flavobacterium sp.]|uniref:O-antigen ligase family protein n=1 Tax=Flavobacterium sp. TaxID=239 RepID=UPI0025E1D474|nr:O-antigen ligase family protein [Flavobacterium sp.]
MGNIYNSLKTVWQNLKKENQNNSSFFPTLLLLVTIPLLYAVNNVAMGVFLIFTFIGFNKSHLKLQFSILLPILLFVLMALSCIWSIDKDSSLKALPKEISLLIIPLGFLLMKNFTVDQKNKIISTYSYSILLLAFVFLCRAAKRYFLTQDTRAFFYHGTNQDDYGLVPKLLNAIHVSVFVAVAFFYFFTKTSKTKWDSFFAAFLFGFILLLSSKNIVLVVVALSAIYLLFFSKSAHQLRLRNLFVFGLLVGLIFSMGRIKHRFQVEFQTNTNKSLSANVIEGVPQGVHYVSIKEAWTNPTFTPNDYFPGTAFRVYQFRIFTELIREEAVFLTGFGLNASYPKIQEKAQRYNLFMGNDSTEGYQSKNFHNQYVQNFAELGFIGFILLLLMLVINVKNAYNSKDFVHFVFAILMISLFLTESFLWRQRGVVFFTLFYCLFNSGVSLKKPKPDQLI